MNSRNLKGLAANMGASVLLAVLVNGFVLLVNPSSNTEPTRFALSPPGYVVGMVWVVLFAAMGAARWLVLPDSHAGKDLAKLVLYLVLFCSAYPVYTLGLRSASIGMVGNAATAALAVRVAWQIRGASGLAALLLISVAAWVTFASYLTIHELQAGAL